MPKRPIGDRALTNTERSRLWRERQRAELDRLRAEIEALRPQGPGKLRRQAATAGNPLPRHDFTE